MKKTSCPRVASEDQAGWEKVHRQGRYTRGARREKLSGLKATQSV